MKVNGKQINGMKFAYDGCHKIYIIEDEQDVLDAKEIGYEIYDISFLPDAYKNSCDLRFISNWKLDTSYVEQFENAKFSL